MHFLAQQNSQWITRDAFVKFSLLSFRKENLDISVRRKPVNAFKKLRSWHPVLSLHRWRNREKMEKVTDYFSWAPKSLQMVTAVMKLKDTCSLEEKLWQTLDRLLKSRDITLPTKVPIVKAMISPVVMYRCESWNIKQAEHWRTDPCELWCWRVPWAARKGILKEILKEINPECSLKRLKLKLQ